MPQDFLRSAGMTGFNSNNHDNYHYIERRIFDELQGPNIKQESLYLFHSASRPAPLESTDHLPSRTPNPQQSVSIQIKLRETAEILCICKRLSDLEVQFAGICIQENQRHKVRKDDIKYPI